MSIYETILPDVVFAASNLLAMQCCYWHSVIGAIVCKLCMLLCENIYF